MKILILTQNIKDIDGMKRGLNNAQSLLENGGLSISFDYKETTKQFTSIPLNTDTVKNGYEINYLDILSEELPGYDITCLIYDWSTIFLHPTNPCTNSSKSFTDTPMQIPVNWYSDFTKTPPITYPEVLSEFFLHEMSHHIAFQAGQTDYTHFKYSPQFSQYWQKSNTEFYLYLIRTNMAYLKSQVTITRLSDDGVQSLGILSVGSFTCKTLERPWKNNQKNISCIPKGTYTVKWTYSPRLLKYTYEVQNVPGRTGIRIHPGNYFFDVDGCILLGNGYQDINNDKKIDVINSKLTLGAFESLMQKKDFVLVIQ